MPIRKINPFSELLGKGTTHRENIDNINQNFEFLENFVSFSSYTEALASPKPEPLQQISINNNGIIVKFVKNVNGPCLGGGWSPEKSLHPEHCGQLGLGDDTEILKDWLEIGGELEATGEYLIAADGADSGGVHAFIVKNTSVKCGPNAIFKAGVGLDNDVIRIQTTAATINVTGMLDFSWEGGTFDQKDQKNSTSIPWGDVYPAKDVGASATTDGLSIYGYYSVNSVQYPGINNLKVSSVKFDAGTHWVSAGGDSGLSASAVNMEISSNIFIGTRDLGFYGSGITGALKIIGTAMIRDNLCVGCAMGVMVKRQFKNIIIRGNIGVNTAELVGVQGLSGIGSNVLIHNNISENAWHTVRVDDYVGVSISGNKAYKHGHLMPNNLKPTFVLNTHICAIRLNGVKSSTVDNNELVNIDPLYTNDVISCVQLNSSSGGVTSTENIVRSNISPTIGGRAVIEILNQADANLYYDNIGTVTTTGILSTDRDLKTVLDITTYTGTSINSTQDLKSLVFPRSWLVKRNDTCKVTCLGTFTGSAGLKNIAFYFNNGNIAFSDLTLEGMWRIDVDITMHSNTQAVLNVTLLSGNGTVHRLGSTRYTLDTNPFTVSIKARTHNAADTVSQSFIKAEKQ